MSDAAFKNSGKETQVEALLENAEGADGMFGFLGEKYE